MPRWVPLLLLVNCVAPSRAARPAPPGEAVLEVMTYNVNYGIPGDAPTMEVLAASSAELVLLQETTPAWERSLRARLTSVYPNQVYLHAPAAGGLAVLSKKRFEVRDVLANPRGWFPALRVVADSSLGPVQVLVVHLRPPVSDSGDWLSGYLTTSPLRRAEVKDFLASLEPGLPTVVAGDFNEGTSGDALRELEARGLRSALPEFTPNAKTWGWDVGALHLSAQLDHLVYSKQLEPVNARVVDGGRSDHQAVLATFVRAKEPVLALPPPRGGSLSISVR